MPPVVWLTGLPAAGKTTVGREVVARLEAAGTPALLLDGDVLRSGGSADLGFDREARLEQAHRAALLALDARAQGRVAVVATISPYDEGRRAARALVGHRFAEVHVHADIAVCRERDPKGLYARAERGELRGVTGVDDPYEPPRDPELRLDTALESPAESVERVLALVAALRAQSAADHLGSAA